jgi:hypothetical protein
MNAIEHVQNLLDAGIDPSVDELGEALAVSLRQKQFLITTLGDYVKWMSLLLEAKINHDTSKIDAVLEQFIAKHLAPALNEPTLH